MYLQHQPKSKIFNKCLVMHRLISKTLENFIGNIFTISKILADYWQTII